MSDYHNARIVYPLCWYRHVDLFSSYREDCCLLVSFVCDGFHLVPLSDEPRLDQCNTESNTFFEKVLRAVKLSTSMRITSNRGQKMAYQTRTHRIYAAVTPVQYRKIQRLAKKGKISAAEWIYEATQDRLNLADKLAKVARAAKKSPTG